MPMTENNRADDYDLLARDTMYVGAANLPTNLQGITSQPRCITNLDNVTLVYVLMKGRKEVPNKMGNVRITKTEVRSPNPCCRVKAISI